MSAPDRRALVDRGHARLSVRRQCELLRVARSGVYRPPRPAMRLFSCAENNETDIHRIPVRCESRIDPLGVLSNRKLQFAYPAGRRSHLLGFVTLLNGE